MKIEIIAVESLGVRGLCCFVRTGKRRILIDPGIALGYTRNGLLPHPFQVAVDERIQKQIIRRWSQATDIIISHFHGDHVPLADANPYQLDLGEIAGLNPDCKIWAKNSEYLSPREKARARILSENLKIPLTPAAEREIKPLTFSRPFPHGRKRANPQSVIMTRIEDETVFVHASDIQLLNDESVSQILDWKPDIALVGGPPLYLGEKIPSEFIKKAWRNAQRLSRAIGTLIIDHHLLRNQEGLNWIKRLDSQTENNVICGADFMQHPRLLLEASRQRLYREMPVPPEWHKDYARGEADTLPFWNKGCLIYHLPG